MARKSGSRKHGRGDSSSGASGNSSDFGSALLSRASRAMRSMSVSCNQTAHANYTAETLDPQYAYSSLSSTYLDHNSTLPYDPSTFSDLTDSAHLADASADPSAQQMAYNYNQYANSAYGAGYANGAPPGYPAQYAQQQQAYQASPPQIRNPFPAPPPVGGAYPTNANYDPDYEQQVAQWNSAYAGQDQHQNGKKVGKIEQAGYGAATGTNAAETAESKVKSAAADGKYTVVRKGGGETWEDKSLLEWDPKQFRIIVGNLAGEVTDDSLAKAFAAYGVSKARVIRDKRTTKSKGFGFVSFEDHDQGFKAAREMVGKYIGSHPVTIKRSTTNVQPQVKKEQHKGKGKNNNRNDRNKEKEKDPLRANTNAGVEKKAASKAPPGLKLLG